MHVVTDSRVTLARILTRTAQGHAVVDRAVVADLGGLADDDTHAVVDEQAAANGRARVDLHAGHGACKLRDHTRQKEALVQVQPVGQTVVNHRVKARIEQKYLGGRAGCRVALANGTCILNEFSEKHKN